MYVVVGSTARAPRRERAFADPSRNYAGKERRELTRCRWIAFCELFPAAMEKNSLIERIRSEFIEMPGLRLTPAQAARLWGMDDDSCQQVIAVLVRSSFLRWTPNGMVVREQ
jgi:hypothetical protein